MRYKSKQKGYNWLSILKNKFLSKQQLWSDRFFFMSSSMRDNLGSVVLFIFVLIHDKGLDKIILHKLDVSFKLCPLPINIETGLKSHLSSIQNITSKRLNVMF